MCNPTAINVTILETYLQGKGHHTQSSNNKLHFNVYRFYLKLQSFLFTQIQILENSVIVNTPYRTTLVFGICTLSYK